MLPLGEAYALSLYPRIAGRTFGWGPYEEPGHRDDVLERLVALHPTTGCREVAAGDDRGHALVTGLRALLDDPGAPWGGGSLSHEAWRLVVDRGAVLRALLDRYEGLVGGADPARLVLTHGEPHRNNTLVTGTGVVLVDWDTCLLAPPERDLWMLTGEDRAILGGVRRAHRDAPRPTAARRLPAAVGGAWPTSRPSWATCAPPHVDDDDTRTAWAGLRAVLEEGEP